MADPKAPARAAVLAGALTNTSLDPADVLERLTVPAALRQIRAVRTPLDLSASEFRYRVLPDRTVTPLRDRVRHCGSRHRGR